MWGKQRARTGMLILVVTLTGTACPLPNPDCSWGRTAAITAVGNPTQARGQPFTVRLEDLDRVKEEHFSCSEKYLTAMRKLRNSADEKLAQPLVNVMQKTGVPPSGDTHDYFSLSRYYWPNPDTADGLPYIRLDDVNPEAFSTTYDKTASETLFTALRILAPAYYLNDEEKFAQRAAEQVRMWFLAPATRMNPNLQYAGSIPGGLAGRAVVEWVQMVKLLDGVEMLKRSQHWTSDDDAGLHAWVEAYVEWMSTHPQALDDANRENNHGTWYDVQLATLLLYAGQHDEARSLLEVAKARRISVQIEPDGHQPFETDHGSPWVNSTANLRAFMDLATLAERVGVDLWSYQTADGRGIRKALDFLVTFAFEGQPWPWDEPVKHEALFELLRRASRAYDDPHYEELVGRIPDQETVNRDIGQLLWPAR
ncbi:MAG: alginate lyase family protein [Myxococcota bacterium]